MSDDNVRRNLAIGDVALVRPEHRPEPRKTGRDIVAPIFRQRKLALLVFAGVLCGAILTAMLIPRRYEAEMKIFVNRDRADTVVTPDLTNAATPVPAVSAEDLNSEVELLTSRDLLDKVVLTCGLEKTKESWWTRIDNRITGRDSARVRLAESERNLQSALTVEPLQKTTVIRVAYSSPDPRTAERVLQTLATLYQEKHAAVHRPSGSFNFFRDETAQYDNELAQAEARRIEFDRQENVVAPDFERQLSLQQISTFTAEQQQDESEADAAAARVKALRAEEEVAPKRQTTEMRQTGNAQLLAELRGTLLTLELRRTDMLVKYAPSYPPVKDVETQIEEAQRAVEAAEQSPVSEVTTDRVPTQDWIATALAKAQADRAQYLAQAASMQRTVRLYEAEAQRLDQVSETEADLTRAIKTAEDNYLLYLRKGEEARISDALDERRIVNVSMAEAPAVPAIPSEPFGWILVGGVFTAGIAGVGAAYAADRIDSSFRTPEELNRYLGLKVLAAIPRNSSSG
ncbi:MAG: GumC family protein [Candidatus Acidiferrales bacterium]